MEYKKTLSIKEWAEEDKPREKMLLKGKGSLSDAELVAILLGSGTCLLYTSPSPRDATLSRMPSSA